MTHIIQKQVLELTLDEGPERVALHDDLVRRFKESTVPALGKLFDNLAPEHLVYKIDRLEIDLGGINPNDFEKELLHQLEKLLHTQLTTEENAISEKSLSAISKEQSVFHQFIFFLKNGHFTWSANGLGLAQMEKELPRLFRKADEKVREEILKTISAGPSLKRLKVQFSKKFHSNLVAALLPFGDLEMWKKVFDKALPTGLSSEFEIAALFIYGREQNLSESKFISQMFKQLTLHSKLTEKEIRIAKKGLLKEVSLMLPDKVKDLQKTLKETEKPGAELTIKTSGESQEANRKDGSNVIYIKNAGVILFWPYLQRFFGNLGLIDGNQFKDRSSTERAVRMLQFLASPDGVIEENLLPLNKVLCDLDVHELVPTKTDKGKPITISKTEKKACRELTAAVIENWGSIGKTSVEGFQTSFLQREGKLEKTENGWSLKVEQRSFDMLLNSLPWSINLIKLPWMPRPLHVEW